jgi:hypothetical protein
MTTCQLVRTSTGFAANDENALRLLNRTKAGDLVEANCTVPRDQRSHKMHNLYFAVIRHVFENLPDKYTDEIPNATILRKRIFHEIGFVDVIQTRHGPKEEARSIEHARLGQGEFHTLVWEPTIRLIDRMAPGLGEAFRREYREMVG